MNIDLFDNFALEVILKALKGQVVNFKDDIETLDEAERLIPAIEEEIKINKIIEKNGRTKFLEMRKKVYVVKVKELENARILFDNDKEKMMDYLIPISMDHGELDQ